MTDQTRDRQPHDHGCAMPNERPANDTVRIPNPDAAISARAELSSLSDPCSSAEFAAVLGKSPKTVVDWCQERAYTQLPCFRLGNRWYHRVPELMRWLNGIKSGHIKFRRRPRNSAKKGR